MKENPYKPEREDLENFPLLKTFLNRAPSALLASKTIDFYLEQAGFEKKSLDLSGDFQEGQGYWIELGPAARIAFLANSKTSSLSLLACHTDSPLLKIKQNGFLQEEGVWMAHVEPYGSPILASWFFRDLGLCGSLFTENGSGISAQDLLIEEPIGLLLGPAIHLERGIDKKGTDPQKDLKVLLGRAEAIPGSGEHPLATLLKKIAVGKSYLEKELFFYPLQKASSLSLYPSWVASSRIDNLASCAAALEALLSSRLNETSPLPIVLFADHEEIGSETFSGASSVRSFQVVEEILSWLGYKKDRRALLKQNALLYSVDGAHGVHPCYKELYEPSHLPRLGGGVVVKFNARYSTYGTSSARLKWLANLAGVPLQNFHMRADLPCGSTIGPLLSTKLGFEGVDLGLPQLAMHASREMLDLHDYSHLRKLLLWALEKAPARVERIGCKDFL